MFFLSDVGCTPLILAATAGHASTVEILLDHGADIEAQSDRTKDTALSLACSGGRQEVSFVFIHVVTKAFNLFFHLHYLFCTRFSPVTFLYI